MTTKEPFGWLRYVEKALLDLDDIPMLGHAPAFDWHKLESKMRQFLQISDLKIKAHDWSWQGPELIEANTLATQVCLNVLVLPLHGVVSLLLSEADLNAMVSWVVQHQSDQETLISSQFAEGLAYFIATEVLHEIETYPTFDGFLLRQQTSSTIPTSRSLVLDISVKAYKQEIRARLLMPETLRKQWLQHFSKKPKKLTGDLTSLHLNCSLELARVQLSAKEWQNVSVGDFIPLKNAAVDLEQNVGSLYFSVSGKPIFRARIKNNGLKILEQPIYEEDSMDMDHDHDDLLSEISNLEAEQDSALDPIPDEGDADSDEDATSHERSISVQTEKTALEKVEMVPLNVVVEVARFKMSCQKLLHLKPGNLIELGVSLEKPVDLVANGKKIATGELVRIGESLGVQILDIG